MLIFRGVSENSASRFTANSRDFPVDLCFLEPDNLKLVKSSHRKWSLQFGNKHHFHFFCLKKTTTFHKIFLHQKASGSSIPNIFSFKNGLSPPWRHVCSTGSLFTGTGDDLTLAKKGAFRASRRFHSGFCAAKNGGIFATRFQNMWKSWKKWTKAISLHSLFGWIERQTIWASNNKVVTPSARNWRTGCDF